MTGENNFSLKTQTMATKKKSRKKDMALVASSKDQAYEVDYIHDRYGVPKSAIRAAIKSVGISRRKIYAKLREMGYVINPKKAPKK